MFNRHAINLLSVYIDKELNEKDRTFVEEHLKTCPNCLKELKKLEQISSNMQAWTVRDLEPSFDQKVKNAIVREALKKGEAKMDKKNWWVMIPSGVFAVLLLFVFSGNFFVKRGIQGRLKVASDEIGEQFSPGASAERVGTQQYEPYYMSSRYDQSATSAKLGDKKVMSFGLAASSLQAGSAPQKSVFSDSLAETGRKHLYSRVNKGIVANRVGNQQSSAISGQALSLPGQEGSVIIIQPLLPTTADGEKVIRNATLQIEVASGREAYEKITKVCSELNGYLADTKFYKDSNAGRESGRVIVRIPKANFERAIEQFSALGKVENLSSDSQDVKQQYNNLKTRLDAVMVIYNKMVEALKKKQATIDDTLRTELELTPILQRIEQFKNQLESLENSVEYTTININFYEPYVSSKVLKENTRNLIQKAVFSIATKGVGFLVVAIPFVVVLGIWAGVIIAIILLLKKLIARFWKQG